ncbi:hypothetical protein Gbfr_010_041 [Gluconobacter frateurii M-2]|nr:hypothetical protein Gbfr_010_041 [Gluconobacter frateurii M-2]
MSDAKRSQQPQKAVRSRRVMRNVGVLLGGRAINAPHSRIHIWPATHLLGSRSIGACLPIVTLIPGKPLLQFYIGKSGAVQKLPVILWLLAVVVWGLPREPLFFRTNCSSPARSVRLLDCLVFFPKLALAVRRDGLIGLELLLVLRTPTLRTAN